MLESSNTSKISFSESRYIYKTRLVLVSRGSLRWSSEQISQLLCLNTNTAQKLDYIEPNYSDVMNCFGNPVS